jgi:hypothetical protein
MVNFRLVAVKPVDAFLITIRMMSAMSTATLASQTPVQGLDLTTPFQLSDAQRLQYHRDGFIKLRDVLSPAVLAHYGAEITREVMERSRTYQPLAERDTYGKAFL